MLTGGLVMRTLFLTLLAADIAVPAVAQTQAPQQPSITKGEPVAVVYYRCEHGGGECKPHKGPEPPVKAVQGITPPVTLYYVHNGVALDNLPKDGAWIKHAANYPTVDEVHVCSAEAAFRATKDMKYCCTGSENDAGDKQWRAWTLVSIQKYTGQGIRIPNPPIAIMWRFNKDVTHNGVFVSFTPKGGSPITDFKNVKSGVVVEGTLEYLHWVNRKKPIVEGADAGRIAENPDDFDLLARSEDGKFEIKKID